ncbi:hypothetical protein [Oceanicella sp. SM1341]|uniref:hypothetical protein n=1 Tax=Oceanicella sp. SM1341 TaxID=1548889 RepID=UPI000E530B6A|nr:hypothetical protein [Oceanicella sp. SM1341]
MKLILHIGPHKTGSSSIQASFSKARESLAEQGVVYHVDTELGVRSLSARYSARSGLALPSLLRVYPNADDVIERSEKAWQALEQNAPGCGARLYVISSEHFAALTAEGTEEAVRRLQTIFDEIKVVAYARDPVSMYASSIQQQMKGGLRLSTFPMPGRYGWLLRRQIEPFAELVGKENVIVRNFSRDKLHDGDAVQDFAHVLGMEGQPVTIKTVNENESICGAAVAWLMMANETADPGPSTESRHKVIQSILASERLKAFPSLKLTDKELQSAISAKSYEDMVWVNETFLPADQQLKLGPKTSMLKSVPPEEIRNRVRNWIMSYLTQDAAAAIAEEIVSTKKVQAREKAAAV